MGLFYGAKRNTWAQETRGKKLKIMLLSPLIYG